MAAVGAMGPKSQGATVTLRYVTSRHMLHPTRTGNPIRSRFTLALLQIWASQMHASVQPAGDLGPITALTL